MEGGEKVKRREWTLVETYESIRKEAQRKVVALMCNLQIEREAEGRQVELIFTFFTAKILLSLPLSLSL